MIVQFVEYIIELSKIDRHVKDSFILLVEVFSGRKFDEIQTLTQGLKTFTFNEKVEKVIKISIELFLPDLKSVDGLFRVLISIVLKLLKVKSFS